MKSRYLWKSALLVLGAVGTVVPASFVTAAEVATASNRVSQNTGSVAAKTQKSAAIKINDVSLGTKGELTGFVLDGQGKAVADSRVIVRLGRKNVAETTTGATGQFRVEGLRGGVYQIVHADGVAVFRVWKNGTAPRNAKLNALLIAEKHRVVRGQDGVGPLAMMQPGTLAASAAAITGATLGVVGLTEASDANDEADAANAKLDALLATNN
ncbi:MAG: carboxypeptidase-like regulatory domain-containing protein [Planctomycetales bacterium]|jgi:hypothetical protein